MTEQVKDTHSKPKGFFSSLMEKIDAKLKKKAGEGSCCAPKEQEKGKKSDKTSCCN